MRCAVIPITSGGVEGHRRAECGCWFALEREQWEWSRAREGENRTSRAALMDSRGGCPPWFVA